MRNLITEQERIQKQREYTETYMSKPGNLERARAATAAWAAKPENIIRKNKWRKSYIKRPHVKVKIDEYHNRPEVKARKNARTALSNVDRVKHKNATPAWYDKGLASDYYLDACLRDGPHEVDHIVPIRSETVCGLNVHYNLQVLERLTNRTKLNSYNQDMMLKMDEKYMSTNYKAKGAIK